MHIGGAIARGSGDAVGISAHQRPALREAEELLAVRRRRGVFASIDQVRQATKLSRNFLRRLAEADAFGSLGLPRRQALWQVMKFRDQDAPLFDVVDHGQSESQVRLPAMGLRQEVLADYSTAGLSLKRHPVALVRKALTAERIIAAKELGQFQHGSTVRVAGLVLIRQRPGTASGIVFVTLEDETGVVNLIVRPEIYERYRRVARSSTLLQAQGRVERQGQVIHVLVTRLHDLSPLLLGVASKSRDFH